MKRVIIMLDLTETEAEQMVDVLDATNRGEGARLRQALDDARSAAPSEAKGLTLAFRSRESALLGGKASAIVMAEATTS